MLLFLPALNKTLILGIHKNLAQCSANESLMSFIITPRGLGQVAINTLKVRRMFESFVNPQDGMLKKSNAFMFFQNRVNRWI